MVTRLLLAGTLGLTLATVSLEARAQGFGFGFGGGGIEQEIISVDLRGALLLFDAAFIDLVTGKISAAEVAFGEGDELLQQAVSEFRSFR
ncbi:MAG: hypothetical protein ACLP4V_03795 [Methylocella sp.]